MYIPIPALLRQFGKSFKASADPVFQHHPSLRFQQLPVENNPYDPLYPFGIIGRVGKDDVELPGAALQEAFCRCLDGHQVGEAQFLGRLANETGATGMDIHGNYHRGPPRCKLVGYVPCTCIEIEYAHLIQVKVVLEDIEKTLFGQVSGRSYWQSGRHNDLSSPVVPPDYSQRCRCVRL